MSRSDYSADSVIQRSRLLSVLPWLHGRGFGTFVLIPNRSLPWIYTKEIWLNFLGKVVWEIWQKVLKTCSNVIVWWLWNWFCGFIVCFAAASWLVGAGYPRSFNPVVGSPSVCCDKGSGQPDCTSRVSSALVPWIGSVGLYPNSVECCGVLWCQLVG